MRKVGFQTWAGVAKVFEQSRCATNEAVLRQSYSGEPQINENIEEMSEKQLDFVSYKPRNIIIVSCAGIKIYECSNSVANNSVCVLIE